MGLFGKKKKAEASSCYCGGNCTPEAMARAEEGKEGRGIQVLGSGCAKCNALEAAVQAALHELDSGKYGTILRAKGILPAVDGTWIHFDYVPEECNVRTGSADITGKLCVIGSKLDEAGVAALFGV